MIRCKRVSLIKFAIACGKITLQGNPRASYHTHAYTETKRINWRHSMVYFDDPLHNFFRVVYVGRVEWNQTYKRVHDDVIATAKLLIYCCQHLGVKPTPRSFLKRYGVNNSFFDNDRQYEKTSTKTDPYSTMSSEPLVTGKHERWKKSICHDSVLSSGVSSSCPLTWKR